MIWNDSMTNISDYPYIIQWLNDYFIVLLFVITLILAVFKKFNVQFNSIKYLNYIRWTAIIYALISLLLFIMYCFDKATFGAVKSRMLDDYFLYYWLMLFCSILLPFTLLFKNIGSKGNYLLLVIFLMNIGWYMELFISLLIKMH
jgi:hypothetical protein